ncbi:MAG: CRISPR-associated helicase Cas3' [Oscillospiraceae bacterium]|nr:CRISPR-associated helicase Cas3' [Oscillospiraceae bacterium]
MSDTNTKYLAHISEDKLREETVKEHCLGVAELAAEFAEPFGSREEAYFAGILHDIGKYTGEFQKRIHGGKQRVDHSTAGAKEAKLLNNFPAAFATMGHHGGIPNSGSKVNCSSEPTYFGRLKKELPDYSEWKNEITLPSAPRCPDWFRGASRFSESFYIRMLFSCLVDADFLKTEEFMNEKPVLRGSDTTIESLREKMLVQARKYLDSGPEAETDENKTAREKLLIKKKNEVLSSCLEAGKSFDRGLYTLTAPTGGGKTFASLAFALEHANEQKMSRIIYVIPYTSIIDQTVGTYEDILGKESVLAHHFGSEYQMKEKEDRTELETRRALASENWDSPVVVTTAVQFFESLFSNKPSRCRKLHNIANSVVIFDEAQTLPVKYLEACVAAIAELARHYGVTAVLCTATQPALQELFDKEGCPDIREICPDSEELYDVLERTTIHDMGNVSSLDFISERLQSENQVLCIVNTRANAQSLYESLPEEGSYCLTTFLCSTDRKMQLDEIRQRLKDGLSCRVVATSLIEAGVDVDFPVVYREYAGLDSILQAAGRCNRNGKRAPEDSPVYIFEIESTEEFALIKQNISAMETAKRMYGDTLNKPEAVKAYFTVLQSFKDPDKVNIMEWIKKGNGGSKYPFADIAENFKFIDEPACTVYIPLEYSYGNFSDDKPLPTGSELCGRLRNNERTRALFRALGLYSVQVYKEQFQALEAAGALEPVNDENIWILRNPDNKYYNPKTGLTISTKGGDAIMV